MNMYSNVKSICYAWQGVEKNLDKNCTGSFPFPELVNFFYLLFSTNRLFTDVLVLQSHGFKF